MTTRGSQVTIGISTANSDDSASLARRRSQMHRVCSHRWTGPGAARAIILLVDAERSMANTEPDKPFNREPLQIKDISGSMVTFSVGGKIYIGLFRGGTVALTRLGRLGTLNLERLRQRFWSLASTALGLHPIIGRDPAASDEKIHGRIGWVWGKTSRSAGTVFSAHISHHHAPIVWTSRRSTGSKRSGRSRSARQRIALRFEGEVLKIPCKRASGYRLEIQPLIFW